jgi:hypothetical protein
MHISNCEFVSSLASHTLCCIEHEQAPMKSCTGVNTKIIYGLSSGLPVITTQMGALGLDLDSELKLYAFGTTEQETPQAFAALLTRMYGENEFWSALMKKGLEAAKILTDRQRFYNDLRDILKVIWGEKQAVKPLKPMDINAVKAPKTR